MSIENLIKLAEDFDKVLKKSGRKIFKISYSPSESLDEGLDSSLYSMVLDNEHPYMGVSARISNNKISEVDSINVYFFKDPAKHESLSEFADSALDFAYSGVCRDIRDYAQEQNSKFLISAVEIDSQVDFESEASYNDVANKMLAYLDDPLRNKEELEEYPKDFFHSTLPYPDKTFIYKSEIGEFEKSVYIGPYRRE